MSCASPGRGLPASIISIETFFSNLSGSKSSKLEILLSFGTTIFIIPPFVPLIPTISSAGNFQAESNQGNIPKDFHPVRRTISVNPSVNRLGSPRNLLIKKPTTLFLS